MPTVYVTFGKCEFAGLLEDMKVSDIHQKLSPASQFTKIVEQIAEFEVWMLLAKKKSGLAEAMRIRQALIRHFDKDESRRTTVVVDNEWTFKFRGRVTGLTGPPEMTEEDFRLCVRLRSQGPIRTQYK